MPPSRILSFRFLSSTPTPSFATFCTDHFRGNTFYFTGTSVEFFSVQRSNRNWPETLMDITYMADEVFTDNRGHPAPFDTRVYRHHGDLPGLLSNGFGICRHVSLTVFIGTVLTLSGTASADGCKVRVQSYVIFTEPSYYAVAGEPTVTPVQKLYRGLIDLNVQLTGDQHLEVLAL